jgi:hypothetical protein
MSWKSIVTAGVLCVVASPVFAVPQLSVTSGGLNAQGQYVWNVAITPTAAGTPLAAELGFRETTTGSQLIGAGKNAAVWDTDNPGLQIFNWETLTDVDPGAGTNMQPVGLQVNAATDEVFSALGSVDLAAGTAVQYVTISTKGPTLAARTSTLQVLGKHGTGSANGRIAEITGTTATNYSNFSGSAVRTAHPGDANMDGTFNFTDVVQISPNYQKAGLTSGWRGGDFDGNGTFNFTDVVQISPSYQKSGGVNTPLNIMGMPGGAGAALGGGSSVPEPASLAIAALGMLAALGFTMRRR